MAINEIDHITEHSCGSKDIENYMYEAVLTTVYGQNIFDYINSKL